MNCEVSTLALATYSPLWETTWRDLKHSRAMQWTTVPCKVN